MLLHDREKLDDDLGARSDHNLSLASLFGIVYGVEAVVEHRSSCHFVEVRFSMAMLRKRYLQNPDVSSESFERDDRTRRNSTSG